MPRGACLLATGFLAALAPLPCKCDLSRTPPADLEDVRGPTAYGAMRALLESSPIEWDDMRTLCPVHHTKLAGQLDCVCQNWPSPCFPDLRLNFALVGFAKCGTTTLSEALRQHPSIVLDRGEDFVLGEPVTGPSIDAFNAKMEVMEAMTQKMASTGDEAGSLSQRIGPKPRRRTLKTTGGSAPATNETDGTSAKAPKTPQQETSADTTTRPGRRLLGTQDPRTWSVMAMTNSSSGKAATASMSQRLVGIHDPKIVVSAQATMRMRFMPTLKVIVSLRDPVSLFLSFYTYRTIRDIWTKSIYCPRGQVYPFPPPFEAFAEGCELDGVYLPDMNMQRVLRMHVFRSVPQDRLLLTSLQAMKSNFTAVLAHITTLLGVRKFTAAELGMMSPQNVGGVRAKMAVYSQWCSAANATVRHRITCAFSNGVYGPYDDMRSMFALTSAKAMLKLPLPLYKCPGDDIGTACSALAHSAANPIPPHIPDLSLRCPGP